MFVYIYLAPFGNRIHIGNPTQLTWSEFNSPAPYRKLLKTYILNTETGELIEHKEPERLFAMRDHARGSMSLQQTKNYFWFNNPDADYYEVMPNGDYRKISKEQQEKLAKEAEELNR